MILMILKFSIPLRGKPQVVLLVLTVAHIPESHLTSSFKLEFDEKSYKAMFRGEAKGKQKTTVGGDLDSTFQTLLPVNLLEIWLKCRFCFSRLVWGLGIFICSKVTIACREVPSTVPSSLEGLSGYQRA